MLKGIKMKKINLIIIFCIKIGVDSPMKIMKELNYFDSISLTMACASLPSGIATIISLNLKKPNVDLSVFTNLIVLFDLDTLFFFSLITKCLFLSHYKPLMFLFLLII